MEHSSRNAVFVPAVLPDTINHIVQSFEQNMDHTKSAYLIRLMNHIVLPLAAGLVLTVTALLKDIWLCFGTEAYFYELCWTFLGVP